MSGGASRSPFLKGRLPANIPKPAPGMVLGAKYRLHSSFGCRRCGMVDDGDTCATNVAKNTSATKRDSVVPHLLLLSLAFIVEHTSHLIIFTEVVDWEHTKESPTPHIPECNSTCSASVIGMLTTHQSWPEGRFSELHATRLLSYFLFIFTMPLERAVFPTVVAGQIHDQL
jgi:hypothetical protein